MILLIINCLLLQKSKKISLVIITFFIIIVSDIVLSFERICISIYVIHELANSYINASVGMTLGGTLNMIHIPISKDFNATYNSSKPNPRPLRSIQSYKRSILVSISISSFVIIVLL